MPLAFDYRPIKPADEARATLPRLLESLALQQGLPDAQGHSLPTGFTPLDELLPGGGLPPGRLTEVVGATGSGKLTLVFGAVRRLLERDELAALVDASRSVVPPVLTEPLFEDLLVVRPADTHTALAALDALLRTRSFPLLLLDPGEPARATLPDAMLTRLVREAKAAHTALVVLSDTRRLGARAALRLEVHRGPRAMEVELTRNRLGPPAGPVCVPFEEAGLPADASPLVPIATPVLRRSGGYS